MKNTVSVGNFKIYLPDENSRQFYIFCDLADLFNLDYQGDAVSKLREEIKKLDFKPKPSLDYESDMVSIRSSNHLTILNVAKAVDELVTENWKSHFTNEDWAAIESKLKNWKRPKAQYWNEKDVFSIELNDGSYAFGQVLVKEKFQKTFALFDYKSSSEEIDLNILKKAETLTILHLMGLKLNDRSWKVIGSSKELLANPNKGPWGDNSGRTGSDKFLETIANYHWFGICKWKDKADIEELIIKKSGFLSRFKKKWL